MPYRTTVPIGIPMKKESRKAIHLVSGEYASGCFCAFVVLEHNLA